jgi:transposase
LKLKRGDKKALAGLLRTGQDSVRVIKRAQVLDLASRGRTAQDTAEVLGLDERTVRRIKKRYAADGLARALRDAPRRIPEEALNGKQKQRIVAMLCGNPPLGRARWTIRLTRDEAIDRGVVPKVGRETIRVLMNNHDLKPWREKNVVHSGADAGLHREDGRPS